MTKKIIKWYKKMKFWQFIMYIFTPIAITGEGAILALDGNKLWHIAVFAAVVITGYIKYMITDNNNDGIVDSFE